MGEDQRENGDAWNDEAGVLLNRLGWTFIGTSNMDIGDGRGKKQGLDRIYFFPEGNNNKRDTGVFVEAKRFDPESLSQAVINSWVDTLSKKVEAMRVSAPLFTKYPNMRDLNLHTGLIVTWVHDDKGHSVDHRKKLDEYLRKVPIPAARTQRAFNTGIFLIENSTILRMASMIDAIDTWKSSKTNSDVNFYYPSSTLKGNSVRIIKSINIPYLFSNFIFAKGRNPDSGGVEEVDMIFNFGTLDLPSFERLRDAALRHNMINESNDLVLFNYERDVTEFRKIRDDVIALFSSKTSKSFELKAMNISSVLPPWMVEGHTN